MDDATILRELQNIRARMDQGFADMSNLIAEVRAHQTRLDVRVGNNDKRIARLDKWMLKLTVVVLITIFGAGTPGGIKLIEALMQ
jgi:hypothetical protein